MNLTEFFLFFVILIFSISLHEVFHGWTAYKLGDPTAKLMGRLTLNPIAHIDPIGTIFLPIVTFLFAGVPFGYAKPVPINYYNLRNPKKDMILIGFAGPAANFSIAFLLALVLKTGLTPLFITQLFMSGIFINIFLGVFNLVPIPPMDGSRVVTGILPNELAASYLKLEPFGFIIVLAMLYFGLIDKVILPLVIFIETILLKI
ncbi:MAG: site-2 protease family protein [Candidatus Omnitrophota bacterium]